MKPKRLPIFPLTGAILFPGLQLPLHIFEPRYKAMVGEALARDRLIGMIQPQEQREDAPLYQVGCVGKIEDVETSEDGRYNIVLAGEARFRVLREIEVSTPFRQVEVELIAELPEESLSFAERAGFESEAMKFADAQGYSVDWEQLSRLDDVALINGLSQIAPFDAAAKQALLEAPDLKQRCELLIQLMEFFGRGDPDEVRVTLQ
ncbi:LON peptidase substrate-binding domain-containing protein [Altererythrobacter sp. KTW20L]|uniref:LON peptidase substrate-binding domain-containing protein n=1 Tax=Altererythrobacter sp. KTW20L TaxID=2942210 RepID=UPI0020BEE676|nr:LON peptidase substrate-binding domain-containing protein [Altererythrobacter sp. KTW20L]MCL6250103.1 LON peptidase substrate-binding domain-containing protein [Altererythrobacter sp. KTW20L]